MNAYICNHNDVVEGLDFLQKFLNSMQASEYDLIVYESITERNVFFSDSKNESIHYFKNLNNKLVAKNIKLIFILSAIPHEYYKLYQHSNIEIIYAPMYFIHFLIQECGLETWKKFNNIYKENLYNNNFNTLVLNLNSRPHYHRCIMMDVSQQTGLIDDMTYTWQDNKSWYDYYKFRWWTPKIHSLNMDNDYYNCMDVLYNNPAFYLVTESEITHISFSEKIFKPLLVGIPFLVLGAHGFHAKLKEYGFELYDEIFDYSFDNIICEETRSRKISENFLKHKDKNLKDLISKIYNKVEKNRQLAISIYKDKKFISNEIYSIFNEYIIKERESAPQAYHRLNEYLF